MHAQEKMEKHGGSIKKLRSLLALHLLVAGYAQR